ncbi:hypothetical protein GTP23_04440 [Pseudoduganella sp. FT93W]|uniref:DUF2029 domain-containing protein n=1 Tax=Duganella fentianensis TaxID=2692177 RepID=A0A845HTL9_9BURK|nr:hypothetical protein [Duganella fentianensis]MYN44319.1 hypothetical protein [Duganella fentianensis]
MSDYFSVRQTGAHAPAVTAHHPSTPAYWAGLLAAYALLALVIMYWRWGGTVEDSLHYFETARYLRGELPLSALTAPFPYRLLLPALAAYLPGDVRQNFALLNWVLMSGAAWLAALTAARLGYARPRVILAGLLLLVAVPTFWYAPYLLVDPGSICARTAFVLGVVSGLPWLAALAGVIGTAIREENIVLLFWLAAWLLFTRRRALPLAVLALAAAGAWMLAVRWYFIVGLPSYRWLPSWWMVQHALADWRSLLSLALAGCVVLPLALTGWRQAPQACLPLKSLLLLMALPPLYAALCVRVDGRIIWGLYPMLIPLALSSRWLERLLPAVHSRSAS